MHDAAAAPLGLVVRAATAADCDAVAKVVAEAFAPYRDRYTPAAYAFTTPPADEIRRRLDEGPVLVAELDGHVVGTASFVLLPPDTLYLRSVGVVPEAAGRGVGTVLVQAAIADARKRGFRRVELCTTPFLEPAIRLYERLGFVAEPGQCGDMYGTPQFTMVCAVEPSPSGQA